MSCKHEHWFWLDDGDGEAMYCPDCHRFIGATCEACGGEGMVEEDEYEGDFINFGNDLIVCPECGGNGFIRWSANELVPTDQDAAKWAENLTANDDTEGDLES